MRESRLGKRKEVIPEWKKEKRPAANMEQKGLITGVSANQFTGRKA